MDTFGIDQAVTIQYMGSNDIQYKGSNDDYIKCKNTIPIVLLCIGPSLNLLCRILFKVDKSL